jgi:HEPN domain-containing protein
MKQPLKHGPPGSPQDWLVHAESDLHLARVAKERNDVLPEQSCFHAQQAVEKALKAVLLFKRVKFPLSHDIEELLELAKQNGLMLPPEVWNAGVLTPYAVEARYPGHLEEITSSNAVEAIRLAEAVLRWASEILSGR